MAQAHRPLTKCHVLFLGSSVPIETLVGVEALERPLMTCYPNDRQGEEVEGIDAWLTVYTSGIQLQLVPKKGASPPIIWFPIQNLYVVAATKCVNYINEATGEIYDTKFLETSDPDAKRSSHPPIFSFIVRKTKGKQILMCYSFITREERSATMLVSSAKYAYQDRSGWSDQRPPDEMIYSEIVLGEEGSDDEYESESTSDAQVINVDTNQQNVANEEMRSPGNTSQNISDSDLKIDDSTFFDKKLVRKYQLRRPRGNTVRSSQPASVRRPMGVPFVPAPRPVQPVMMVKPMKAAPRTVIIRQPPPPPKVIRTPPMVLRMPPPKPVVHVVREPPVIMPPRIIRQVVPVRTPPPPPQIIRQVVRQPYPVPVRGPPEVQIVKEKVPVPVPVPGPPQRPEIIREVVESPPRIIREPYPVRSPTPPPEVIREVVREPYPVRAPTPPPEVVTRVIREAPEVVERPVYIRSPPEVREVHVEVPYPVEKPVYTPVEVPVQVPIEVPYYLPLQVPPHELKKHRRKSKPRKGYEAYDDRFQYGRGKGDSYFISDLPSDYNGRGPEPRGSYYVQRGRGSSRDHRMGRHRSRSASSSSEERYPRNGYSADHGYQYRMSNHNGIQITELPPSPQVQRSQRKSRGNKENYYSPEREEEGQYRWKRSPKGKHKKNKHQSNGETVDGYDFYRPDDGRKGKSKKKSGREASPSGRENYYFKENQGKHGGPPRNWMQQEQEFMNERAFSSSLAAQSIPDPDTVDGEQNAYALNADNYHTSMYDRQMPGGVSSDGDTNLIPPPPPLPGTSGAGRAGRAGGAGLY